MTGTDTLDGLERTIARTLAAKADQLVVDDPRHSLLDDAHGRPPATVIHLTPRRPSRRRVIAVAVAAAVVLAGLGVASRLGGGAPEVATPAAAGTTVYLRQTSGTVGFLPDAVPAGWSLSALDVGASFVADGLRHWQLFGDGESAPLDRGVLVASAAQGDRVIEGATRTVHGEPAWVGPPADPSHPAGAVNASWIEDDVVHDAISVGLGEDELIVFLDRLARRDDPITGFDSPDTTLAEVGSATVGGGRTTMATYVGPAGTGDTVRVTAESTDRYGGLLHRLDGADSPGGRVRRGTLDSDARYRYVAQARDDGWSVEVLSTGSETAAADPAVLDAFLTSLRPASYQEVVDLAVGQSITGSYAVGGGHTIEVHGTPEEDLGVCVSATSGTTVCAPAEALPGTDVLVAASLVVDGRWVVVTLSDAQRLAAVRTEPDTPDGQSGTQYFVARTRPGERIAVSLVTIPEAVVTAQVTVPGSDDTEAGFTYENPLR
jgi:hypothetical protein